MFYANFLYFSKDKTKTALDILQQTNAKAIKDIDFFITEMENRTILPDMLLSETGTEFEEELEYFNQTNVLTPGLHRTALRAFDQIRGYNLYSYKKQPDYLHSAFIYNLNGFCDYKLYIGNSFSYTPLGNKSEEGWFQKCLDAFGEPVIIGTRAFPEVTGPDGKWGNVFSVARGIVNVNGGKLLGVFLVNANTDYFRDICSSIQFSKNQSFLIVDSEGGVLYSTSEFPNYRNELLSLVKTSTSNWFYKEINDVNSLVSFDSSKFSGITLINMIALDEFNKDLNTMKKTTFLVAIIIIVISFIFVFLFSRHMVKPLKRLVVLMKLFEKGDFDVRINIATYDEVGILARTFNNMSKRIKKLVQEVYIDKIKQKELELQMLQNQINPHFLYNTLDSIHMMAELNNDMETSKMARVLGRILRYSISNSNAYVTVREELNHLQDYIALHQVRFAHIFSIKVNCDPDILDVPIIKLFLQPIVENAINHGLKGRSSNGIIEIFGYRDGINIAFEINDNGIGMNEEQTSRLNGYINGLNNDFSSIGLKNVNKRIKLHYGDKYGIEIFSTPGMGTKVKVTIPYPSPCLS
ncbi:MAG TPA: sensor histidine kinase [Clostridiaceae bacterium]|nr:sensor histidine kinase [Clostridiaceae bacterium]